MGIFWGFLFEIVTVHQSTLFNDLNLRGCSNRLCIGGCYFVTMGPYSVGVGVRDQKYQINQKMEYFCTSALLH